MLEGYVMPEEIYSSKTLVELNLRSENCFRWWHTDNGSSLPMLKSLDIDSDIIFCDELEEFVPSFPVLEYLRMANMEWRDSDRVTVSSASLRKLCLHATGCEGFENPKSISFDIPNLHYLSYADLVAEDHPLVDMPELFEARINLILIEDQIERIRAPDNDLLEEVVGDDVVVLFVNVVKLLNGIQNVEKLQLLADTLEVLSLCCISMPVFNNLKFLCVKSDPDRGWQAMPVLLKNCPHLETIIFKGLLHHVTDKCGDACPCISREDKGGSLTSCPVKTIKIQRFRGTMKEMTMIKHFLDYFPCLKLMNICIEEKDPTQLGNPEVLKHVLEMFKLYNKLSSCDVKLLVSDFLKKKWTEQGHI